MSGENRARRERLPKIVGELEALEGRALMAAGFGFGFRLPTALPANLSGRLPSAIPTGVKTDPAGAAAILGALNGGSGSEFVGLIRSQVPNITTIVNDFTQGRRTEFTTSGIAAKIPKWNEAYTGTRYDHLTGALAGAVLQGNTLQLGAVMRGPFDEAAPSSVVFGLDRGAGGSRGPLFPSRPGITPDLLVTIHVGPYGKDNSATITDLSTGATTTIDPSKVQVVGAVARVFVDLSQIPSKGLSPGQYKFAMWTRSRDDGGVENVGSFVAESTMVQVGVPKTGGSTSPGRPTPPRFRPRR